MSREIKFRAWHKKLNIWVYFTLEDLIYGYVFSDDRSEKWRLTDASLLENEEQHTGLLDKGKKEIYEGDIVDWDDGHWNDCNNPANPIDWENPNIQPGCAEHDHTVESVVFETGQFTPVCWADDDESTRPPLSQCKVIGNIYESPELLKNTA